MSLRARTIFNVVLIGFCLGCLVTFVVQHFMTVPRPSWHKQLPFLALAFAFGAPVVHRPRWRRARQNVD